MRTLRSPLWLGLIPFGFFVWGALALPDYGVNVDEPLHFMRGQAYLNLYLTGSKDYSNITEFPAWLEARKLRQERQRDFNREQGITPKEVEQLEQIDANEELAAQAEEHRFSVYQEPTFDAKTFIDKDYGHPPLNGVMAAAFNKVLYQQLGWVGDVESYHLFEVFVATLGIALVMYWAYVEFGLVASLIAGLALALHPMYLGESRFNVKDPIETVFFAATLFAVWKAVILGRERRHEDESFKWLLGAGLAFGAAVATKFNAFFVLPILGLWFLLMLASAPHSTKDLKVARPYQLVWRQWWNPGMLWGIPLALVVAAAVVYASWPDIWQHPVQELKVTFDFYYQLGTSEQYAKEFITPGGWNLYPLLDVLLRAPLITLLLAAVGVAGFFRYRGKRQFATLLLLAVWLVIPILRVTLPDKALYGATRQIMEYLPAMAIFAGIGGSLLVDWVGNTWKNMHWARTGAVVAITLLYVPIIATLVRYHPNPQLFYNSAIGGLRGAYEVNFPFWNNTMNNAYTLGVDWINANAEQGARLSLVTSLLSSLPPDRLRPDIQFSNFYFSGPLEEGEYIMEVLPLQPTSFIPKYIERFLEPVYTYEVDGVPLLAIWKNDGKHTKEIAALAPEPITPTEIKSDGQSLVIDFGAVKRFHRLKLVPATEGTIIQTNNGPAACTKLTEGALSISSDGTTWARLENIPYVGVNRLRYQEHAVPDYLFAGDRFRYINIGPNAAACLLQPEQVHGWIYED